MPKNEQMRCPHCGTTMQKSPAAWVMGEANIPTAGLPETTPCPACGRGISVEKMVRGEYDADRGSWLGGAFFLVWFVGSIAISVQFDLGFWASVGLGLIPAAAVTGLLALLAAGIRKLLGR
ncbi:MAG: hypothetical protein ACYTGB_03270 [Planctomycetota bacterium]|jgi:hypothetical protein